MPQLDITTYSSQLFYCFVTFGVLYLVLIKTFFPTIAKILKIRKKLINHYEGIFNSLKYENKNEKLDNLYLNLFSNYINVLNTKINNYNYYLENINNYKLSFFLHILKKIPFNQVSIKN